jgi:hypothetical protein
MSKQINTANSSPQDIKLGWDNGTEATIKRNRYQITEDQFQKLIESILEKNILREQNNLSDEDINTSKKIKISIVQLEALLNHILNPLNKSVTISENVLNDTFTFKVYEARLAKFLAFINDHPSITVHKKKRDGHYYHVTLINSGRFEAWNEIVTFYKSVIKI